jgi:hypothetical protein
MIYGGNQKAVAYCDWPGCRANLELARVDSRETALALLTRLLPDYGWLTLSSGRMVCDEPEHRAQALEAWDRGL